jgi:hypothetical protein
MKIQNRKQKPKIKNRKQNRKQKPKTKNKIKKQKKGNLFLSVKHPTNGILFSYPPQSQ